MSPVQWLLELAPVCTLLFIWSVTAALGLAVVALAVRSTIGDSDLTEARLSTAFDYAVFASVIFGSGMIVLGVTARLMSWWAGQ